LSSDGWSKRASSRASLTKLRRPSSKVSRIEIERTETCDCPSRCANWLGMYSLIATSRSSAWSRAR